MDNNRQNIFKKIFDNLEVILEQAKTINNYEGTIPKIELDIIMSYVREVYEELNSLDKIINNASLKTQAITNKPKVEELTEPNKEPITTEVIETPSINIRFDAPKVTLSHKTPEKINISEEVSSEKAKEENLSELKLQEKTPKKQIVKESSLDLFGTPSIADKFKDETPSLNDLLIK